MNKPKKETKMTTDQKIVFLVERALATNNSALLFELSTLLGKRAMFERCFSEIVNN